MRLTILAACLLGVPSAAFAIVNPHDTGDPKRCDSCHTSDAREKDCGAETNYCLLTATVDGVCQICHRKTECCEVGQEHMGRGDLGHSHPSGMEVDGLSSTHAPLTLPVHLGRITCNTCHLHERSSFRDYKMVRIVRVSDRGVDWTGLCKDCHPSY